MENAIAKQTAKFLHYGGRLWGATTTETEGDARQKGSPEADDDEPPLAYQRRHSSAPLISRGNAHSSHNHLHRQHQQQQPLLLAQLLAGAALLGIVTALLLQLPALRLRNRIDTEGPIAIHQVDPQMVDCARTCKIELVETLPQNVSFGNQPGRDNDYLMDSHTVSTFFAWKRLISEAKHSLAIAAYKTSLRGKHVLGEHNNLRNISTEGEAIYDALLEAGKDRGIAIRMVENALAKDKGDNEDGLSLYRRGALRRRILNLPRIYHTGVMHSKFIVADGRHFYLGSANLDWRSLSQKMELGVMVRNCPCMAQDLLSIFDIYWRAAEAKTATEVHSMVKKLPGTKFNAQRPLKLADGEHQIGVHLAASPQGMNTAGRAWDLTAILDAIKSAKRRVDVHVMDYFPMFLYSQNRRFWPHIDNALREAVMRGVQLRIIAAALHYPSTVVRFLKSLEELGEIPSAGSVQVKIFKVPTSKEIKASVLRRDRRTHKKYLLTDDAVVIGTSNWSGDYFEGGTGVAIVMKSLGNGTMSATNGGGRGRMLERMTEMFEREWNSEFAHPLDEYVEVCVEGRGEEAEDEEMRRRRRKLCEDEKDAALLALKR